MVEAQILIVDDDPKLVQLVREVLIATGYDVVAASSGERAIEMVALEQPDLVLLDIRLPGSLDGYEICRRIREFSDVAVIILTARRRRTPPGSTTATALLYWHPLRPGDPR